MRFDRKYLIQARIAVKLLGIDDRGKASIPIASLEPIKNNLLSLLLDSNEMKIDRQHATPIASRADYVTLNAAGVLLRESPRIESLDEGIIGITLIYESKDLANEITMKWNVFPDYLDKIETTIIDPFGGSVDMLTQENLELNWKKQLGGYMVPAIEQVMYQKPCIPIPSIVLIVIVTALLMAKKLNKSMLIVLSLLSLIIYPFIRVQTELPFVTQWKPSHDQTINILDNLLTNVYRSFNVRNEDEVYDRLATSVEGDQLTEIYLQNRKSMELEYRGEQEQMRKN